MSKLKCFGSEGFKVTKNFLKNDLIKLLNLEIDELNNNILFNGFSKGVVVNSKVKYSHKTINLPISNIASVNLMEVAIDVFENIFNEKQDFILTNLEIFIEKNNQKEMILHTDQRRGMVRAQIYLKGGGKNSGGFKYIQGSNLHDKVVEHDLNEEKIKSFEKDIIDLSGDVGDLVAFDPWGYHGKNICINERRTIMFEFQSKSTSYDKSSLDFNNLNLTPRVLENIELFLPDKNSAGHNNKHGVDFYKNNYEINSKVLLSSFFNLLLINTRKKMIILFLKFKNKIKKIYSL